MFIKAGHDEEYRVINTRFISYFKIKHDRPQDMWLLIIHVSDTGIVYGHYNSREDAEKELEKLKGLILREEMQAVHEPHH